VAVPKLLRRTLWVLGGFVAIVIAATIGCSLTHPDATTRLARHFDLDDVSDERVIEAELAAKMPAGTSEEAIYDFLRASRIGEDPLSSWSPADENRVIECRVKFDPTTFGFVKESYGVSFRLDEQRTLATIHVDRWLTGL
jgi:hypothetical protein